MSYCRFSTDSFRCDFYAYESVGDFFALHVAGYRVPEDTPWELPLPIHNTDAESDEWKAWFESHKALMDHLSTSKRIPIDNPHAGQTYSFDTLREMYEFMLVLEGEGFVFPQCAKDRIEAELMENGDA